MDGWDRMEPMVVMVARMITARSSGNDGRSKEKRGALRRGEKAIRCMICAVMSGGSITGLRLCREVVISSSSSSS